MRIELTGAAIIRLLRHDPRYRHVSTKTHRATITVPSLLSYGDDPVKLDLRADGVKVVIERKGA